MLLWDDMPSAMGTDVQVIFRFEERCRIAARLIQASSSEAARNFVARSKSGNGRSPNPSQGPAAENERTTLVASDMAAGLRLIYTAKPGRLSQLAARAHENDGLLPDQGRAAQSLPMFREAAVRMRLLTRQAHADAAALNRSLQRSGEQPATPEPVVALSTGMWRLGIALSMMLQSGREVSLEGILGRGSRSAGSVETDAALALALARSTVRPSDWTSRAPVDVGSLIVFSGEIREHFVASLNAMTSDLRRTGRSDAAIRSQFERRQVPRWLIARVLRDDPSPWRGLA